MEIEMDVRMWTEPVPKTDIAKHWPVFGIYKKQKLGIYLAEIL